MVWLMACASGPDPSALIARWSLDTRGTRPLLAELDAAAAYPDKIEVQADAFLADDRFGDTVMGFASSTWLTRSDEADTADAIYAVNDETALLAAMGEEPLRVLGYVASADLPYTELVTGDWTVIDERLAPWYPTDYPDGATGWQKVQWTDHRPAAGVLATSGLWWRYTTTTGNANRGRANAMSRILLCSDVLERDVEIDASIDLSDDAAVNDALHRNPSCVACHSVLDPMGSYFWGFYVEFGSNPSDLAHYHPERERYWEIWGNDIPPSFYGVPGDDLADLGRQIGADPRFPNCAVEQTMASLLQRDPDFDDADTFTRHREAFLEGGTTLRSLWRSVMLSDEYRAIEDDPDARRKLLNPDQFVAALDDLTGWRFTTDGADAFADDRYGLRSMTGGGRAVFGAGKVLEPTPAMVLTQARMAEAAAAYVAANDHADPQRLFEAGDFDLDAPDEDRIATIFRRALSRPPTDEETAELATLWTELYDTEGDAEGAWAGTLTAILRHPDFLVY